MKRLLVIGAGGHAKVVIEAAVASGWDIAGVIGLHTDDYDVLGHKVCLDASDIEFDAFIIAIGSNRIRLWEFERYRDAGYTAAIVIHPSAVVSPTADIGCGTFVAARAVVNPEAVIGENVILNTGSIVEHDVFIGDHSLIGPNSCLCGGCSVGMGVLLGVGANVRPGTTIGSWTVCGAGSAVVSDLGSGMVYAGVPARPIRPIEES